MEKEKVLLFWSGGKESALALYELQNNQAFEVAGLVTTFDREKSRVPFHGIPDVMVVEQAKMLKLPLQRIFLPSEATNEEYVQQVSSILSMFAKRGIKTVAFGDILLKDVRDFKEKMLADIGMKAIFPLWGRPTHEVTKKFLETGHKALVTAVMTSKLSEEFLACEFNEKFIERLPAEVDPAGENGEFHTFVIFGPSFKMRVGFSKAIAVEEGPYRVTLIKEP